MKIKCLKRRAAGTPSGRIEFSIRSGNKPKKALRLVYNNIGRIGADHNTVGL
jgi:hypothetical protein